MTILTLDRVLLGATASSKEDAIRQVGQVLVQAECVKPAYVDGMLTRESTMSTYLGNGVAIPHGMHENHSDVNVTGLAVVQFPAGIPWDEDDEDELAYIVIGIAAVGDEHMSILSNLAEIIEDEEMSEKLAQSDDAQFVFDTLTQVPDEDEEDED